LVKDVTKLCNKLAITKAHFVGNSMGGFIVQTLAYLHPGLVKSVIISNSNYTIKSCFNIYLSAQINLLIAHAPIEELIKASLSWVFSFRFLSQPGMLAKLIDRNRKNPYPFTITGYKGQYAALNTFNSEE
jgi:3-oxoadipate enol-lactonase